MARSKSKGRGRPSKNKKAVKKSGSKKAVRKSNSKRSENDPWYKFWGGAEGNNHNYRGRTNAERNQARRNYEGEWRHQMQTAMNKSQKLRNNASRAFTKSERRPENNSRNNRTWLNKTRNFFTGRTESRRKAQGRWGNLRNEVLEPAQQKANLRRLNWEGRVNNLRRKSRNNNRRNSRNNTRREYNTVWT